LDALRERACRVGAIAPYLAAQHAIQTRASVDRTDHEDVAAVVAIEGSIVEADDV
jgi:hypothetical protein